MGAGKLRDRLAFDRRETVDDGYGNTEGAFIEQFSCAAGLTYLRGTESVIAARLQGQQPLVARVRSFVETRRISTDWRARNERTGQIYAIRSIAPTEKNDYLDIMLLEGAAP